MIVEAVLAENQWDMSVTAKVAFNQKLDAFYKKRIP